MKAGSHTVQKLKITRMRSDYAGLKEPWGITGCTKTTGPILVDNGPEDPLTSYLEPLSGFDEAGDRGA